MYPGISDFTQQDSKTLRLCVTNVTGLLLATIYCLDLHLTLMFSGLLQKDLSKGR